METRHRIRAGDARHLEGIEDGSVELVVTSPPYPMIELWDDLFAELDPTIGDHLAAGAGDLAFEAMHAVLDDAWAEIERVLVDGGLACINVGDATRRLDGGFRRYANHARIAAAFEELGFDPLPTIYWHKPTNAATKFMGSGMLPPNAYVTQEHEHILVFRKGDGLRSFEPGASQRYQAAYFWEERNRWFSDRWTDVGGRRQELEGGKDRDRAAAYPLAIPYRLIAMYSVYGDTVLDPFWGTGTTTIAAMIAGRNSVGIEIDEGLRTRFEKRVVDVDELAREVGRDRLERHRRFVAAADSTFEHHADKLEVRVKTAQETDIRFFEIDSIHHEQDGYRISHRPLQIEAPEQHTQ